MKTPAIPFDEEKRLASLRESGLLDTGTNERFDRLTRLAKRLFNVPIALVTLVGEKTLHFKTSDGTAHESLPRHLSFVDTPSSAQRRLSSTMPVATSVFVITHW
jgi:hypothetical protein